jgi:hypothetical protein
MRMSKPCRCSSEDGTAAIEAVVSISVLLLFILGIVELGQAMWTYNTMLLAAEEAGRYAMVHNRRFAAICEPQGPAPRCPDASNTPLANCSAALVRQVLSPYRPLNIEISVREDRTVFPGTITICASYSANFVASPFLPYGTFNLTREVTVPLM